QTTCAKCNLPCNICQFLEDGAYPEGYIVSQIGGSITNPAGRAPAYEGALESVGLFQIWLCYVDEYKDMLAQAMVHEAIHFCKEVAPTTPAMNDGPLRNLFDINPWPFPDDTQDIVDQCWK